MTLRAKILVPILLVSALLVGYLYGHWMPGHLQETEDSLRESAQRHLASVAESFVPMLLGRQLDALYENLDALKERNAEWVSIELTLPDGSVLYPLDPVPGMQEGGPDELIVRQRITIHDVELGRLTLKMDVGRRLDDSRRHHGELVFASLLVVATYVGLLWLVLEGSVRRPIAMLAHASKRLAAGEFGTPLHRSGTVEVDGLVDSFSAMRESIRGYQAELIAKSDSLSSLSQAVAQSPISIVIADRAGRVEFANPRFFDLTGEAPDEVIGRPCPVITGACVPEPHQGEVREAIAAGGSWRGEVQRSRMEGEPFRASVFLSPVRDDAGAVAHWLVIMEDITQQRALEQQLVQAQKMEALGTLAGGIAHDFNNVLSPIIGYTELARTHVAANPELEEDLAQVSEAAFRARDLVRQILTFSRKAEKKKAPLRLSAIAQEALKLLRPSIPASIEIRQRFEGDGRVFADPTQIHQVIMNLCTNAYHAMEQSGGVLAVTVEELEVSGEQIAGVDVLPGRYALLSVSDTGVGMSKETLKRIFDPYFTTKDKGKGTGLGLAVVDGIVRDHEGRIAVYSEPGSGTTFRVYFPLTDQPAVEARAGGPQRRPPAESGHERVAVVDDEESIRSIVGRSLRDAGYRVALFASAGEALESLARDPAGWDLLITDMTMPGMNGRELARRVLELRPGFPIVLCCGYSSLISAEEALKLGIRRYVEKPVVMRDLLRIVRQVLDRAPASAPPAA